MGVGRLVGVMESYPATILSTFSLKAQVTLGLRV